MITQKLFPVSQLFTVVKNMTQYKIKTKPNSVYLLFYLLQFALHTQRVHTDFTMFNRFNIAASFKNFLKALTMIGFASFLMACSGGGAGTDNEINTGSNQATNQEETVDDGNNGGSVDDGNNGGSDGGAPAEIAPVVITSDPQSVVVNEGEQVQFSVAASGGGTISFQWRKDGENIAGATSSSLLVSSVELADGGTYDVIASNSVGSAASLTALLTINAETVASVELSWDIPLEREDGSALALYEINGYVISYGTTSGSLDALVTVTGYGETTALIEDLTPNTYYFAIATVDSDGQQGAFSAEIEQIIL